MPCWLSQEENDRVKEFGPRGFDMRAKRAKITAHDWQEYRPFLEQLYLVENVKLKDVMEIMETRFGFAATYVTLALHFQHFNHEFHFLGPLSHFSKT